MSIALRRARVVKPLANQARLHLQVLVSCFHQCLARGWWLTRRDFGAEKVKILDLFACYKRES